MKRFDIKGSEYGITYRDSENGHWCMAEDVEKLQKAYQAACAVIDAIDASAEYDAEIEFKRLRKELEK